MEKRRGRKAVVINLDAEERDTLERWVRRRSTAQGLAMRSRIVLGAAEGRANVDIAAEVGCSGVTVSKWRNRFARRGLDGLYDNPPPRAAPPHRRRQGRRSGGQDAGGNTERRDALVDPVHGECGGAVPVVGP